MSKLVPIQSIFCSDEDETRLCSFDTEVISSPTTPLIHPMSRLWLVNSGHPAPERQRISSHKRHHGVNTPMADI